MAKGDTDAVAHALARAVATREVDKKAIAVAAKRLDYGIPIRGIDPCIYGICLDFVVDRNELDDLLGQVLKQVELGPIKVFPWGIPIPDIFHVQIEQDLAEIPRGFG